MIPEAPTVRQPSSLEPPRPSAAKKAILIVDDNATNRKLLRAQLESEDLLVHEAEDGMVAIELLNRIKVDAIVSDILMPRMDGYRLCYEVRNHFRLGSLPFIFYTSTYTSQADESLGLSMGANRFIRKPASVGVIAKNLRELMEAGDVPRSSSPKEVEELSVLKEYSERLVAKLEEKNVELNATCEALRAAQTELRHTHSELDRVLEQSPAVMYALKVERESVVPYLVSESIHDLLGFKVQEATNYEWWHEHLHPDDRQRALSSISETLRNGKSTTEYRVRHKDGTYRWIEDKRRLIVDATNQPQEMVGIWVDLTEQKNAEQVRSQTETPAPKSRALTDFGIVLIVTFVAFIVTWRLELFHAPLHWFVQYEETLLDELFVAVMVFLCGFGIYGLRRQREMRRAQSALLRLHSQLDLRVQQRTAELSTTNASLQSEIAERKKTERVLEESDRRFREMLENVEMIAMTLDKEGKITFCNDYLLRLTRWTRDEVIGADWCSKFLPESCQHLRKRFLESLDAGQIPPHDVNPIRTRDGEIRQIVWNNTMLRDEAGNAIGSASLGEDVTEQKQAEIELQQSRDRLALATASARIGIWDWDIPSNKLVWDELMYKVYGVRREDFCGAYEAWRAALHPDDLAASEAALDAALKGVKDFNTEFRIKWPNGEERHIEAHGIVQRASDGSATKATGVNWDITERKRADDNARQFANIVGSSNDAIFSENLEGIVTSWNPAAETIFGYSATQIVGRSIALLIPSERSTEEADILSRIANGTESFHLETQRVRSDGAVIDVQLTVSPIKDAKGKIIGASKIARDITRRKQAELRLEQTHNQMLEVSRQAAMAEFATGILHNVGNVLNSVNVASNCLAASLKKSKAANLAKAVALIQEHQNDLGSFFANDPKGPKVISYLAQLATQLTEEQSVAVRELDELQANIEHIKAIVTTQQDAAKSSTRRETVSLPELVEDAFKLNQNALARGSIEVVKDFQAMPLVTIPKHTVLQILINLIRNAIQASDGVRGRKRLTARLSRNTDNNRVFIAISDCGCGIAPENLGRIFSHGFTTKKDGHGFGLHSARQTAIDMGGSLTVHSEGIGRGATFTLELPA